MENLRKIIFVFICVFPFVGISQISFYKKYSGSPFDQGIGLTQLPDSSYAVTGTSAAFNSNSGQAFLMITDSLGNQKWTKNYGGFGEDIGVRVIHIPGDGFFIAGYSGSTSNGNFDFVLYKTDEYGNLQWEKMYGGVDWEKLNDAALLSDGGLILVGETSGFSSQKKDIFMVRTTALGDTVWTKTIRTSEDDFVNAVEVVSATEFIVGGNSSESGISKGMLASYNIDGTKNWLEFLNQAGVTTVNDITIFQNTIYSVGSLNNPAENKIDLWVAKASMTGSFISHYFESFYDLDTYFSAVAVKDGNTMYMSMLTNTPEVNPYPGGLDIFIHKYNPSNLTYQSSHPFSGYNDDIVNQIIVSNDNGAALVGTVSDNQEAISSGTNVMLAKIGPNDEGPTVVDIDLDLVSLVTEEKKTISIYPNPTSSIVNIPTELNNKPFELINIQGQIVKTGFVTSQISLEILDKGIYFLKINDHNQIWSAKIIRK